MRLTVSQIAILVILTGVTFAGTSNAQEILDRQLTLDVKNQSLKEILRKIENEVEVKFAYSRKAISSMELISIKTDDEKLSEVLDRLLNGRNIHYQVIGKQIILNQFSRQREESLLATEVIAEIVTGTVTSERGEAIPGVNILVKAPPMVQPQTARVDIHWWSQKTMRSWYFHLLDIQIRRKLSMEDR